MQGFHEEIIGVLEYREGIPMNAAVYQRFRQNLKEMTILQNVIRPLELRFMLIIMLSVVAIALVPDISHGQTETTNTLSSYLINLRDSNTSAYIEFMVPIDGNPGWAVPEDFTNDAGDIVGRRVIGEIGEDFVCIDSIGQGRIITRCIPFTNIAMISQPAQ